MATIEELLGMPTEGLQAMDKDSLEKYLTPILALEPKPRPAPKVKEVVLASSTMEEEPDEPTDPSTCPIKAKKRAPKVNKRDFLNSLTDDVINNL